jgi:hypothetical protein
MAAAPTGDAELLTLVAELVKCDAAQRAERDDDRYEILYFQGWALRERINRIRASTIEGLAAKARAAEIAFFHDQDATGDGEGSFVFLSRSIHRDLLALVGAEEGAQHV